MGHYTKVYDGVLKPKQRVHCFGGDATPCIHNAAMIAGAGSSTHKALEYVAVQNGEPIRGRKLMNSIRNAGSASRPFTPATNCPNTGI